MKDTLGRRLTVLFQRSAKKVMCHRITERDIVEKYRDHDLHGLRACFESPGCSLCVQLVYPALLLEGKCF
jgi:hypothetical protein